MHFYLQYLAMWPEYYLLAEGPGGHTMGYSKCPLMSMYPPL